MVGYTDMMGVMIGLGAGFFVIALAAWIYMGFALMAIAKRTKTENGWLGFIPIANIYLITQIAKLPAWYTLAVLLAFIPLIGGLALIVALAYFWWIVAERLKRPGWFGILAVIPIVNLIVVGIMAWGK
ncbi:hypothetical protein HY638_03630 [Candidatus Woesearchaeota archaeon]|nr:hypothetical protein [Candidatus Woesearchaeota archaeon]